MTKPTNETGLVHQIISDIYDAYPSCWVFKVHGDPYQRNGVPDLLVCLDGSLVGLEVKFQRPGESHEHALDRATVLQLHELDCIRRAGGSGGVVTSSEEALAILKLL